MFKIIDAYLNTIDHQDIFKKKSKQQWIYFGSNISNYYRIKKLAQGLGACVNSGAIINAAGKKIKSSFTNFDQYLDVSKKDEHFWFATSIAERNPAHSDFFYYCCAVSGLEEWLASYEYQKDAELIVFVEDFYFGKYLREILSNDKRAVEMIGFSFFKRCHYYGKIYLGSFFCRLKFIFRICYRKIILRRLGVVKSQSALIKKINVIDVLLVIWTDAKVLRNKQFLTNDPYFKDLGQRIQSRGLSLSILANPVDFMDSYKNIFAELKGADFPVFIPELCMSLFDALKFSVLSLFSHVRIASPVMVAGHDVTPLLKMELFKEYSNMQVLVRLQYFCIGSYLKRRGVQVKQMLHLFENQPWEKLLRLGIKRFDKNVQIRAYQHTPFSDFYLNYFPSKKEVQGRQLPDRIIAIGPAFLDIFKKSGYFFDALISGPAIRFRHLISRKKDDDTCIENEKKSILLALSIGYQDSFELLIKALTVFMDTDEFKVIIKFHPKMSHREKMIKEAMIYFRVKEFPSHIYVADQSIEEILKRVFLVFFNGTAVAFESVALGIPSVFVQSDIWFDMNKMVWFPDIVYQARTSEEILKLTKVVKNQSQADYEQWLKKANNMRDESFFDDENITEEALYN